MNPYYSLFQHCKAALSVVTFIAILLIPPQSAVAFPLPGFDGISSSIFTFKNVIKQNPPDQPGGWKVACANIPFIYVSLLHTQDWKCETGVGVPEQNYVEAVS